MLILKATKCISAKEIEEKEKELSDKIGIKVVIIPSGFDIVAQRD